MCNYYVLVFFSLYLFRKLIFLELYSNRNRTFFGLYLFRHGFISIESYIIKKRILCRCKNILFLVLTFVQGIKVFLRFLFRKRRNIKISIIRDGICLLECCRNLDLIVFVFVYSLGVFVVNSDDCYCVLNAVDVYDRLNLYLIVIGYNVCNKAFFIKIFNG